MDYIKIKEEYHLYYKTLGHILSPFFKEEISFNNKGWSHIIRKGSGLRPQKEVQKRLENLKDSVEILKIATTVQEKEIRKILDKNTEYYGFVAIINENKIKVIVRKEGMGKLHFYSLMTDYVTSPKRDFIDTGKV